MQRFANLIYSKLLLIPWRWRFSL